MSILSLKTEWLLILSQIQSLFPFAFVCSLCLSSIILFWIAVNSSERGKYSLATRRFAMLSTGMPRFLKMPVPQLLPMHCSLVLACRDTILHDETQKTELNQAHLLNLTWFTEWEILSSMWTNNKQMFKECTFS